MKIIMRVSIIAVICICFSFVSVVNAEDKGDIKQQVLTSIQNFWLEQHEVKLTTYAMRAIVNEIGGIFKNNTLEKSDGGAYKPEVQTKVLNSLQNFFDIQRGIPLTIYAMRSLVDELNKSFEANVIVPKKADAPKKIDEKTNTKKIKDVPKKVEDKASNVNIKE